MASFHRISGFAVGPEGCDVLRRLRSSDASRSTRNPGTQRFTLHKMAEMVAFSFAAIVLAFAIIIAIGFTAAAQDHHHPPHDAATHDRFYSTWMMPDNPNKSCCNKMDCYSPSAVSYRNGFWWATRREDGKWLRVPHEKVEHNRSSPDGRNHLCAPPPNSWHPPDTVFCFIAGAGI